MKWHSTNTGADGSDESTSSSSERVYTDWGKFPLSVGIVQYAKNKCFAQISMKKRKKSNRSAERMKIKERLS